jgi:hypothetical protein
MCDWFTFQVDNEDKMIVIHVNTQVLLETQPADSQQADIFCESTLFPLIDKLRTVCVDKGYEQRCVVNLKNSNIKLMNPVVLVRIICNIYNHTKDEPENLIKGFEIQNANSIFRAMYYASTYLLPEYMTNLITFS